MKFTVSSALETQSSACQILPVYKNESLDFNEDLKKQVSELLELKVIDCKLGSISAHMLDSTLYLFVGAGEKAKFTENSLVTWVKSIATYCLSKKLKNIALPLDQMKIKGQSVRWVAQKTTECLLSHLYQYDHTKSEKAPELTLNEVVLITDETNLQLEIENGRAIAHGINVAKELANLPANYCDPEFLANQARALAEGNSEITVTVLEDADMEKEGMGAFLSISRGSANPGKLIIIEYAGGDKGAQPHVLVGKGLTFDSGGISIKPALGMEEMKYDMGGAASVLGTMTTMAELKPALNIVAIIAAAENMPSSKAVKPGDVVTSMSGKTIEVINTDAEGRMVLCDALTYAARFNPASVIDIATLTGAVVVGLGHVPTAVYANEESLVNELLGAGKEAWDRAWPMPLWDDYREELDSPYADLRNIGTGRMGGSITAAIFLSEFAKNYRWAHLDIAGTAWGGQNGKGASGRPVGLLSQYLLNQL